MGVSISLNNVFLIFTVVIHLTFHHNVVMFLEHSFSLHCTHTHTHTHAHTHSPFPRKEQRNYYNQVSNEESIYASLQEVTSSQ